MSKKDDLIKSIQELNKTADTKFLQNFSEHDLAKYLENLMELDLERKEK